jgi:hypothetical protein
MTSLSADGSAMMDKDCDSTRGHPETRLRRKMEDKQGLCVG